MLVVFVLLYLLHPIIGSPTEDSCFGRFDGFYVKGCSDTYFLCVDGVKYEKKCPELGKYEKARFNPKFAMCEEHAFVEQCPTDADKNEHYRRFNVRNIISSIRPYGTKKGMDQNTYYMAKAATTREEDADGSARRRSYNCFSWLKLLQRPRDQCNDVYVECIKHYCFEVECPKGQAYDEGRGVCSELKSVYGCQQQLKLQEQSKEYVKQLVARQKEERENWIEPSTV